MGAWLPRQAWSARRDSLSVGEWSCPAAWDALVGQLRANGYDDPAILDAGLATRSTHGNLIDRFRDRVMCPLRTPIGDVVGFTGRSVDPGSPKWLNSPTSEHYDKSRYLYGIWEAAAALRNGATVAIVEGPFDAIAVTEAGRGSVVGIATCGTALTPAHADLIAQHAVGPVVVAFDTDTAGQTATSRAWEILHAAGISATTAVLSADDAADTLHTHGPDTLVNDLTSAATPLVSAALARAVEPWLGYFHEPECRVAAMRATLPILAALDTTDAATHTLLVARELGISADALTDSDVWLGMLADALNKRGATSDPIRPLPPPP